MSAEAENDTEWRWTLGLSQKLVSGHTRGTGKCQARVFILSIIGLDPKTRIQ
jgi:hypothetical protein